MIYLSEILPVGDGLLVRHYAIETVVCVLHASTIRRLLGGQKAIRVICVRRVIFARPFDQRSPAIFILIGSYCTIRVGMGDLRGAITIPDIGIGLCACAWIDHLRPTAIVVIGECGDDISWSRYY